MADRKQFLAGVEPGLRFAALLDKRGGCCELDWQGVRSWDPAQGYLWVHLERDEPETEHWIREQSGMDPLVADILLAEESRPRIEVIDQALLLVLRGVNLAEKEAVELVPIHVWIDDQRAVTLRDKAHSLSALRDIRVALRAGRGPKRAGMLLTLIADKIVRDLEPVIDDMEEVMESLENEVVGTASPQLRHRLADVRRQAIHLRRYLLPQRDALFRLRDEDTDLVDDRDRMRLGGVIDTIARHIEDLDALRDRATLLHDELRAALSERIAKTSYRFTAIAALLLPPSLVAALLGANVGGIPGQDHPYAFFEVVGVIIVMLLLQWALLRAIRWL